MGMDIYSGKGFTLALDEFLKLIRPEHLTGIKTGSLPLLLHRFDGEELEEEVEAVVAQILRSDDLEGFLSAFPDKSDIAEGIDSDSQLFRLIQCISRVVLPFEPESCRVFTNPREEDWNGPYDELILIFDYSTCFKERMTKSGQTLASVLGKKKIQSSSWTIMSV
jgi:hypothetical protein